MISVRSGLFAGVLQTVMTGIRRFHGGVGCSRCRRAVRRSEARTGRLRQVRVVRRTAVGRGRGAGHRGPPLDKLGTSEPAAGESNRTAAFAKASASLAGARRAEARGVGRSPTVDRYAAPSENAVSLAHNGQARTARLRGRERGAGSPRATEPGCGAEPHVSKLVVLGLGSSRQDN
jgi:hypothetical protein